MKLFTLGGSGGKVTYAPYDATFQQSAMSAARTKIRDDTTYRAYESQLNADIYRDANISMLNEGLGLLSNFLDKQKEGAEQQSKWARYSNDETYPYVTKSAISEAQNVSDSLMGYISSATDTANTLSQRYGG